MVTPSVLEFLEADKGMLGLAIFVALFFLFSLLEMQAPRRHMGADTGWRWAHNFCLAIVTTATGRFVRVALSVLTAWWATDSGLLQLWAPGPLWILIVAVVLLDLTTYLTHRLSHTVPLLWRIHRVHHSDTDFDLTTTFRQHPLSALVVLAIRLPVIALLGIPAYAVLFYEFLALAVDLFSHSNVRLPEGLDRRLRRFIVTPDYHRAHHVSEQRLTNSNYVNIFPFIDHLFGTASHMPYAAHEKAEIGLEYFRERRDGRIDQLLLMPFRRMGEPALSESSDPEAQETPR
ncbi:MAG: sterol desaturase/sphingolipid hydroxylase (fatty acid hydroxylase superfamily) [Halieaceae bacterium]|jgi:sterol desaturase/sphingolipid hydroxylase (fatty acid hydroxylase superfamily)